MSSPINAMLNGTFTTNSSADPVILSLEPGATEIEIFNITDWGSTAAATPVMLAEGRSALTVGSALVYTKTNGAATLAIPTTITSGGFTFFADSGNQPIGSAVAVTGIDKTTRVVTSASPAVVGDVVRVYATTGMLQVAGMDFTVTAATPGVNQTLGYLAAQAANATAGFIRVLPFQGTPLSSGAIAPDPRFYPRSRYVTAITKAASAVVTMSVAHSFTKGEKVRLIVPQEYGMVQMNNLLATITAVSYSANTITLDIDSTGFSTFAFPTSAVAAGGVTFAQVVPVGEAAINTIALPVANSLDDRTRNTSINGVIIGSDVLEASKTFGWVAKKGLTL